MALNRVLAAGNRLALPVSNTVESGDPVAVGDLPGVAVTDYRADDGTASVQTNGVFDLDVKAENGSGNKKVDAGDAVYLQSDGTINIKSGTGVRFGYALVDIASGDTDTIPVKIGY